ncbi:putative DnaJ domain, Chaperone J-domain superfamily [Helianthus anomalus]
MASSFAVFRLPEVFNHRARIDNLSRPTSKSSAATCCMRNPDQKRGRNYYDLLGVTVNSNPQEIKDSYRRLQKKYHPDIAGQEVQIFLFASI